MFEDGRLGSTVNLMDTEGPFEDTLETSSRGGYTVKSLIKNKRFQLLVVVALIITVTAVVALMFIFIPNSAESGAVEQIQVCNASDCVLEANHLKRGMNENVNPCDDFYEYVCGSRRKLWQEQGVAYNDEFKQMNTFERNIVNHLLWRQLDSIDFEPAKTASIFYKQCLNLDEVYTQGNVDTIIRLTAKFGGWPSLKAENDWNDNDFDLVTTLSFIFREYYPDIFFKLSLVPHGVNETVYVIKLKMPNLIAENKLLNESYSTALQNLYAESLCEAIGNTSRSRHCERLSSTWSRLRQDTKEVIELERDLNLAAIANNEYSNAKNNQEFTVAEFQNFLDENFHQYLNESSKEDHYIQKSRNHNKTISWKRLFDGIFATSGIEINDNQVLIVSKPDYFIKMAQILQQTSKRTIANYIWFYLFYQQLWEGSQKIFDLDKKFDLLMAEPVHSRYHFCFSEAMENFAVPVMHEYLKTKSNLESRDMLVRTAEVFRATFDRKLRRNNWLTNAAKLAARKKLEAIKFFIGYPNWLLNATEIEKGFEGLHVGSNYIDTLHNVLKNERAKELQKLGKNPEELVEPWFQIDKILQSMVLYEKYDFVLPSDVGAYYDGNENFIVVPLGQVDLDSFYSNVPSYIIYSRAGFTIGHEMLHGFDSRFIKLDKDGQNDTSWNVEDDLKYKNRSECYREQYEKFEVFPGTYLNGSSTLNENIADNEGLKLAYITYKEQLNARGGGNDNDNQSLPGFENFSTEQMFFISYSSTWCEYENKKTRMRDIKVDPHSPGKFRVNGVLQNFQEFARAWNCPVNAPMSPETKCTLF